MGKGGTLLEICTPALSISRISAGYQKYAYRISRGNWLNFNEISDRFQHNIKKYLLDIPKCYSDISRQWAESKKLGKTLKTAIIRPKPIAGYQPDIKAFFTLDIMSCHPLIMGIHFTGRSSWPFFLQSLTLFTTAVEHSHEQLHTKHSQCKKLDSPPLCSTLAVPIELWTITIKITNTKFY